MSKLLITLIAILNLLNVFAQNYENTDVLYERVWFATDRDVYIPGDELMVSVATIDGAYSIPITFSAIVYLELFTADHTVIVQEKVRLEDGRGSVTLQLPKTIKTDFYYLRAYTNYQKNFGEASFLVQKIRVVNPFKVMAYQSKKDTVDSIVSYQMPMLSIQNDSLYLHFADSISACVDLHLLCNGIEIEKAKTPEQLNDSIKSIFLNRYRGVFQLTVSKQDSVLGMVHFSDSLQISLSIDSVRSERFELLDLPNEKFLAITSVHPDHGVFTDANTKDSIVNLSPEKYAFQPELFEDMLYGMVDTFELEADELPDYVLANITNTYDWLQPATVGKDGRFAFSIEHLSGNKQLQITPTDSSSKVTIQLQDEFYPDFVSIKKEEYVPEKWLAQYIKSLMIHVQLRDAFSEDQETNEEQGLAFYGNYDESVVFKDFINLPTFEDYVLELMPSVYIKKKKKRKYIRVSDYDYRGFVGAKPLVLVDGIPYYDHAKVISLSPKDVDRVYVVNHKFTYYECVFDGVLDIRLISDAEGTMEMPTNTASTFFISAKTSVPHSTDKLHFPNIQYWNPVADDLENGKKTITRSNEKGLIRVKGISAGKTIVLPASK